MEVKARQEKKQIRDKKVMEEFQFQGVLADG